MLVENLYSAFEGVCQYATVRRAEHSTHLFYFSNRVFEFIDFSPAIQGSSRVRSGAHNQHPEAHDTTNTHL